MSGLQKPTLQDRLWASFRALTDASDPLRDYRGLWEYAVQQVNGDGTVDLALTDTSQVMPPLRSIVLRGGVPGLTCKPSTGSTVYVMFANGDPTKPFVVGFDSNAAQSITLNAGTGSSEHVATVESVVNMFINFIYFLQQASSTLSGDFTGSGKILDPVTFPAQLTALLDVWLNGAASPLPPTATTPGGLLLPNILLNIQAALLAKRALGTDALGAEPNLGCPNITAG